jgi:hypothetical protein
MTEAIELGPVDYLVVEFPGNQMTGEALPILVDLVDRGIIHLLDLAFVRKDADGTITAMEVADFDGDGSLDLAVFEGASSGLLGESDISEAANALEPNSSAGIIVFENAWAAPFVGALHRSGAEVVASGRIPADDLIAALEAVEALESDEA